MTGQELAEVYDAIVSAISKLGTATALLDDVDCGVPLREMAAMVDLARTATTGAWDALAWAREQMEATA